MLCETTDREAETNWEKKGAHGFKELSYYMIHSTLPSGYFALVFHKHRHTRNCFGTMLISGLLLSRLPHVDLCIVLHLAGVHPTASALRCAGTYYIVSRYYVTLQQCICLVFDPARRFPAFLVCLLVW